MFTFYLFIELLKKDRQQRITINDTLDHRWFVNANSEISAMRKEANKDGNDTLKFISYSNVDAKAAQKLSQGSQSPKSNLIPNSLFGASGLNHGPGSGNLPGMNQVNQLLDNINMNKPSSP